MNISELKKRDILVILVIIIIYFCLRIINITTLPIFTDEAIYLRWAQIALGDPQWRFISLIDGKQPMFIWLTLPILKLTSEPLLSGRLVSVFAGLFGMIGSFLLAWELFKSKKIGYITASIYLLSPFFLWYDRIALYDSLLASIYVWILFLEVLLVRRLRLDIALILGMVIGAGVLTKTSAFFGIYLLPFFLIIFDWKNAKKKLPKFILLSLISVVMAYVIYGVLRLSPWFYIINQKDHEFIYGFNEILKSPFAYFFGNMRALSEWWFSYTTVSFAVLLLIALFWKDNKTFRERILLFLLFILPFCALAAFGKVIYPRFILFMTLTLLPLYSYAIDKLLGLVKQSILKLAILLVIFAYPLYFDYLIIFDVIHAPLTNSERFQFLDDWPSGYGVNEVVEYINNAKTEGPVFLATEGTFGLFPYAFELEYYSDPLVTVKGYWPFPKEDLVREDSKELPTYLVLKESQSLPAGYNAELIYEYKRGLGNTYLKFYRLTK